MPELTPRGDRLPRKATEDACSPDVAGVWYAGAPIHYVALTHTPEEAWARLDPGIRQWAEWAAGAPIPDPFTGAPSVYWHCRLDPGARGPRTAPVPASYALVMFATRGLVVSSGRSDHFVDAPEATRWEHEWRHKPVDDRRMWSDHRWGYAPRHGAAATTRRAGSTRPFLPAHVAERFGNLPVETQQFLLDPFLGASEPPVADVHASTSVRGGEYAETYWVYLYDDRQVAFAHAVRAVPYRSGLSESELWNGSPESIALAKACWSVAAWRAPVVQNRAASAPPGR